MWTASPSKGSRCLTNPASTQLPGAVCVDDFGLPHSFWRLRTIRFDDQFSLKSSRLGRPKDAAVSGRGFSTVNRRPIGTIGADHKFVPRPLIQDEVFARRAQCEFLGAR